MKKSKEDMSRGKGGEDIVELRKRDASAMPPPTKPPPTSASPYSFMRRSCTFVAESSLGLRKSASRTSFTGQSPSIHPAINRTSLKLQSTPVANKVVKDRRNLAMQVRQKKDMLEESTNGSSCVDGQMDESASSGGRMSRLVGGLRAWSSTEDVRQSFMGAIGRTVSVIKQQPVSRKVKQAFGRPDPSKPEAHKSNLTKPDSAKHLSNKSKNTKYDPTKVQPNKVSSSRKTAEQKSSEKVKQGKAQAGKFQFGKSSAERQKLAPSSAVAPALNNQRNPKWFRHIQEAQEAYTARDGRNRRSHPQTPLQDSDDQPPSSADALRDVDDSVDVEGGDSADSTHNATVDSKIQGASISAEQISKPEEPSTTPSSTPTTQAPASPDTLAKKTAEAGGASSSSSGPGGPSPSAGRSPASGRRLQEVQIIQIVEGTALIQPSEVKVSQGVVLSAEPVLTPIEHLRRKDLKIRQALEEKQRIIADILNIPHEHFENVVDMAGEPAVGNKEPRELVLAAMFQAKCFQETLNEALNISEGDIVAARANNGSANKATSLPLYQAPMTKLLSISTALSQQLSSLLNLVSERDDERERMRKELVASRERLHHLHMRQNSVSNQISATTPSQSASTTSPVISAGITPPTSTSPHTSRPSSFVSVASTAEHSDTPDHHDTDEDGGNEVPKINSSHLEECEDSKEDSVPETFEDAESGSEVMETNSAEVEGSSQGQESSEGGRECEGSTETIT